MSKEIRRVNLQEFRAFEEENDMILEGYAAVFGRPTVLFSVDGVDYSEVIDRTAFDKTDMRKCCLKYNHESSVPVLARVRGGSLELSVDDRGLFFRAKLFNTQTSRDIYEIVKAGGIDECSFAFSLPEEGGDYYDKATHTRHLSNIEMLWDCSVVDYPAYEDGTYVSSRSFLEAEAEKDRLESLQRQEEAENRQREREKLALKIKLEGFLK